MTTVGVLLGVVIALAACSSSRTDEAVGHGATFQRLSIDASAPRCSPEPCPDVWSLVVLPDTQNLTLEYPQIFTAQTRWIASQRAALNIRFVLHVGDLVHRVTPEEWTNAKASMAVLEAAKMPYAVVTGNHDIGWTGHARHRGTLFHDNRFFGPKSTYARQPTLRGFYASRRTDTSYHVFEAAGERWLVIALEFAPRDGAVNWAERIVERTPHDHAILLAHGYLHFDGSRYDRTKQPKQDWNPALYRLGKRPGETTNDGEQLWRKLVSQSDKFRFVICGHSLGDGVARNSAKTKYGNTVHELMANFQSEVEGSKQGGEGFLRVLVFQPKNRLVLVQTYSPYLDSQNRPAFKTSPDHLFTLALD